MLDTEHDTSKIKVYSDFHKTMFKKIVANIGDFLSEGEAEEVAQEALLKIFIMTQGAKDALALKARLKTVRSLVFVIAKNLALSRIRHVRVRENYYDKQRLVEKSTSGIDIEAKLIADRQERILLNAINTLPPICRQVFIQRKLHAKSYAEIASILNISVKTVENHVAKGLKLCREHMLEDYARTNSTKQA